MALYIDLFITDNDLTLTQGLPVLCDDRVSIAQDIKHLIRESGLLVELIAERNPVLKINNIQQLILLIENDDRLIPGTIEIVEKSLGTYYIAADTVDFGYIDILLA
jgi:hypothetical protein